MLFLRIVSYPVFTLLIIPLRSGMHQWGVAPKNV